MTNLDPRETFLERNIMPVVLRPRSLISGTSAIFLAVIGALSLFVVLDARRRALVVEKDGLNRVTEAQVTSPPPLAIPPAPQPPPEAKFIPPPSSASAPAPVYNAPRSTPPPAAKPTTPVIEASEPAPLRAAPPRPVPSSTSQMLIVDTTTGQSAFPSPSNSNISTTPSPAGSEDAAVRATVIRNRSTIMAQGTLIAAVLETPLNSDQPGPARALISRDARSFDGSRVLIPRGSRLIGEFSMATETSQYKRILVTWTRLIRPDGVAIRIGSPATDALGGTGIPGRVNTHFFARFANAVLQSALTIGVNLASQTDGNSVFVGIPGQFGQVGQTLLPNINPRTTIKVKPGTEIAIFVARDLEFSGTPAVR